MSIIKMKTKTSVTTLVFAFMAMLSISCSNDNDSITENKKLENTSWEPVKFNFHNADNVAVDKVEENSIILTKIGELQGLEYSEEPILCVCV